MEDETVQYQAVRTPHQVQATINMIDVFVAGRACEIGSMYKHNTNPDMSLATVFRNVPASGVFEN